MGEKWGNFCNGIKGHKFCIAVCVGVVAVLAVIALWAWVEALSKEPQSLSHLGLASSIISIVVGLIAIVISLIFSMESLKSTGQAKTLVNQTMDLMTQKTNEIASAADKLLRNSSDINPESPSTEPQVVNPGELMDSFLVYQYFVQVQSRAGILLLYLLTEGSKRKRVLSLVTVATLLNEALGNCFEKDNLVGYVTGYIAALSSFVGLSVFGINHSTVYFNTEILVFPELVSDAITKRIEDKTGVFHGDELSWGMKAIDQYFVDAA